MDIVKNLYKKRVEEGVNELVKKPIADRSKRNILKMSAKRISSKESTENQNKKIRKRKSHNRNSKK